MNEREYSDIPNHKKRSKTASKSKSNKRADHKHDYEKVIVEGWLYGWFWGERCKVCGRMEKKATSHRNSEFVKPEMRNKPFVSEESYYTAEELKALYPEYDIYGIHPDYNVWDEVYVKL